jgi:hypothetical protein
MTKTKIARLLNLVSIRGLDAPISLRDAGAERESGKGKGAKEERERIRGKG